MHVTCNPVAAPCATSSVLRWEEPARNSSRCKPPQNLRHLTPRWHISVGGGPRHPTESFEVNFSRRPHDSTYQKVVQGCPPLSSENGAVCSEPSFLEHFCLEHFSVFQGKFYMQMFSNTSFGRTLLGSNFGGLLLEQMFCRHFAAFPTFRRQP